MYLRMGAGLAAALVISVTPALCAEAGPNPQSLALSKRLFAAMHMDTLMSSAIRNMVPAMTAAIAKDNPNLTPEQQRAISEAATEVDQAMMSRMTEQMIPLYAETFSQKELEDSVAFYEGPSGKSMLAKMPTLMARMTPTMVAMMPDLRADMTRRICAKTDCSKLPNFRQKTAGATSPRSAP